MASLNKILNKINKAKSAINSFKGISSKLKSLNFTSALDKLGEQAEESKRVLEQRRSSLEKGLEAANGSLALAKQTPNGQAIEYIYPLNDILDNYIVFTVKARTQLSSQSDAAKFFAAGDIDIMLYVPDGITSSMSVDYENKGKSALGVISNAVMENTGDTLDKIGAGLEASMEVGSKVLRQGLSALTGDELNRKRGLAVNPMKEQYLNGVSYRSFEFMYEFWPKSKDEADMVNKIIYTFRSAMLPDTSNLSDTKGGVENYFNYPNKFTAEFSGPIADTLDGYLEMVCTKCDVDHFNGQKFAVFEGGQPISTKMTIGFTEMEIMSQQNYHEISAYKPTAEAS
tara:strand:+ start:6712 stop:7737 length:1026 start_codon:yes stop_codon:yes gene_type:complete